MTETEPHEAAYAPVQQEFLEQRLTTWAAGLQYQDLASETVVYAKRFLLDILAVAWAGSGAIGVGPVHRLFTEQGGKPESRIWISGERVPAASAAFVNGMYASALDFDSVHDVATVHPDIVIVPALLAIADRTPLSGRDFLAAYVAGTEMLVRLGMAVKRHPGWFLTAALGVFASAAASARALDLGSSGVSTAMGIALSRAAGSQQSLIEGSFTKRLQSAYAARDGVEAAMLAQCGVTAPGRMFGGAAGFETLYVDLDHDKILDRLGGDYFFTSLTLKNYPSCFCNHAAIIAALDLVQKHSLTAEAVETCTVSITPFMARMVGSPFSPGDSPQVAAQFSVQYSVANVLARGAFRVTDIEPKAVLDPDVMALAARIKIEVDTGQTGKFTPASVCVRTRDGKDWMSVVTQIPGTPALPSSNEEVHEKALMCFASGVRPMPKHRAEELISRIDSLECLENMQDLWCFN